MSKQEIIQTALKRLWFGLTWIPERLILARYCPYGDPVIFDPRIFPWSARLEKHWKCIRLEAKRILTKMRTLPNFQDLFAEVDVTDDDRWKTYFLYGYGLKVEAHCAQCPETTRLLEAIPEMTTAFFSILHPRKHIPPHREPYKGVLRYHLGLIIPRGNCRIRIGHQVIGWEEGRSLLFDDTQEHEVWNETDHWRVVLFMDVVRPLPKIPSAINGTIVWLLCRSPQVRRAYNRQLQWIDAAGPVEEIAANPCHHGSANERWSHTLSADAHP